MDFIREHWMVIATALWAICEVLALTPLKSNSVFTLIYNSLKSLVGSKSSDQNQIK